MNIMEMSKLAKVGDIITLDEYGNYSINPEPPNVEIYETDGTYTKMTIPKQPNLNNAIDNLMDGQNDIYAAVRLLECNDTEGFKTAQNELFHAIQVFMSHIVRDSDGVNNNESD